MPELSDLDPAVCERLLRRGTFGRVGITTPDGPEILPVNYTVRADTIVVRTADDGVLARYADGAQLVFEVDLVDETRWQGWSVVARGVGELVAGRHSRLPGGQDPRPWADGDRSCELRLTWTGLTGRQVGTGWDLEALLFSRRSAR
jgi:hypothetical protein